MSLRRRGYLAESWVRLKHLVPGVRNPLFHGTSGPKVASIVLRGEGIKGQSSDRAGGAVQSGISLTRGIEVAFEFGNYVLVVDSGKLPKRTRPVQYGGQGWTDEREERYMGSVPFSAIAAVVVNGKASRLERREYGSVSVPLIQKVGSSYEKVN